MSDDTRPLKEIEDSEAFRIGLRIVDILIIAGIGGTILGAWYAIELGQFSLAGDVAQFSGAVATVGLLRITYSYVRHTEDLVEETRKNRKAEIERKRREDAQELDAVRTALIEEINSIAYLEEMPDEYSPFDSLWGDVMATTVYEANANKIGRLTEEEVTAVVNYYTRVYEIERLLKVQREHDTPYEKDAIMRYFKTFDFYFDSFLRKVTFGLVTPKKRESRTELIRERYRELATVQEKAADLLKNNKSSTEVAEQGQSRITEIRT